MLRGLRGRLLRRGQMWLVTLLVMEGKALDRWDMGCI